MHLRRLIGTFVSAALVATPLTLVATSSPAAAATPTVIVADSSKGWIYSGYRSQPGAPTAGDTIYFAVDVKSTDGSSDPYEGTVVVQRLLAGTSTWTTIARSTYAGYYGSTKAVRNASYRVIYSGSSRWARSSRTGSIAVQHKIKVANKGNRRVLLVGKVAPKYRGKVVIQKKAGKRWKKWKVVKTNRKSTFKTALPAPKRGRYYWRVRVPAGKGFALSTYGPFYTYKL